VGQRKKSHWNGSYSPAVPVNSHEQAWQCVDWYRCHWIVEDYHQCLKTGCRIEERQVQSADRRVSLLGLLSPVAVRLLQLRSFSRSVPRLSSLAGSRLAEMVAILAARTTQPPSTLTLKAFWTEVARMGGSLARSGDGPPGWTIWGRAGFSCKLFLRGFTLLLASVPDLWVKDRLAMTGAFKPVFCNIHRPGLLATNATSHVSLGPTRMEAHANAIFTHYSHLLRAYSK
jgi:hypothetical protein